MDNQNTFKNKVRYHVAYTSQPIFFMGPPVIKTKTVDIKSPENVTPFVIRQELEKTVNDVDTIIAFSKIETI